jgi:3-dehydroquinate synthase
MQMDKKVRDGRMRLVLLKGIGLAELSGDYDPAALQAVIRESFGP